MNKIHIKLTGNLRDKEISWVFNGLNLVRPDLIQKQESCVLVEWVLIHLDVIPKYNN